MTSRVPMVSLERARELGEAMGMPARRTQSEAFRVVANNPGVARVAFGQLMQLLENNKFDTRLRELMIMRIGWVTGSVYEWTNHWRVATTAGIPPEDILAVRDWRNSERLTQADKAILAATDECLAGKSISDAAWAEVAKHVTEPARHGQLDDVFPIVPKFAHSARRRRRGLAARRAGVPGRGEIGGSGEPALNVDYALACRRPLADRLRKVIDQRVTSIAAMLCSHSCRASPVK